jgi:hypothetical protein
MSLLSNITVAERLIGTVMRAFYVDNVVAVMDCLMKEKFIREGNKNALYIKIYIY